MFFLAALREASASCQILRQGWQADEQTFPRNGNTFNDIEEHGRQRSHWKYAGDNVIVYRDVNRAALVWASYSSENSRNPFTFSEDVVAIFMVRLWLERAMTYS